MRRIVVSPLATRDLESIHDYIARDNPDAALRLIDRLDERFSILKDHPAIGKKRDELQPGIRCWAEGNYLIVYRSIEDHTVEIVRVLHSKRNIRRIIRSRQE